MSQEPAPPEVPVAKTALERVSTISVCLAIVVFMLNMAGVWHVVIETNTMVGRTLVEGEKVTATSLALKAMPDADGNGHTFINHLLSAELQLRTVQNQQMIAVIALAASFAMMAIGFALFIMGAEGAFKIAAKAPDGSNVVLKSTAPGLLCFLFATLLVWATLSSGKIQLTDGARDVAFVGKPSKDKDGSMDLPVPPTDTEAVPPPPTQELGLLPSEISEIVAP